MANTVPLDKDKRYRGVKVDTLTGNAIRTIQVATGVDVADAPTRFDFAAAMTWWSALQAGDRLDFEELCGLTYYELTSLLEVPDEEPEPDDDADPSEGSTPSPG